MTMQNLLASLVRNERAIIALLLAIYGVAFVSFYPQTVTNKDEILYIRQAHFYAAGQTSAEKEYPVTGEMMSVQPSRYPVATSLMMIPFIETFGWKGAFMVPFIGLFIGVLVTARWIREEGLSPLFALVIIGYPSSLVFGRVATSDATSLIPVVVGLYCFWRGQDRGAGWWLVSGFAAGASVCWRESNVLLFACFFFGALIRRDPKVWALIIAGLVGISMRPLSAWLAFGDPFYYKQVTPFSIASVLDSAPRYLVGLMALVPFGLAAGFDYRGRRWPEQ